MQRTKLFISSSAFAVFLSQISAAVDALHFLWRTGLLQPLSAAHTFDQVTLLSFYMQFSQHSKQSFSESSDVSWLYMLLLTSFSAFSKLVGPAVVRLFTLSISLIFDLFPLAVFRFSSSIFRNGLIFFRSLGAVISLVEVSKGSTVLTVFNESSAEVTGDRFCELVTAVDGTQTRPYLEMSSPQSHHMFL